MSALALLLVFAASQSELLSDPGPADSEFEMALADVESSLTIERQRLEILADRLALIEAQLVRTGESSSTAEAISKSTQSEWTVTKFAAGITVALGGLLLGAFGWPRLRRKMVEIAESVAKSSINSSVQDSLNKTLLAQESKLISMTQALALAGAKLYDDALRAFEWTGDLESLRAHSPIVALKIVESLHRSKSSENRNKAWDGARVLLERGHGVEFMRLFLQVSVAQDRTSEGILAFESTADVRADKRCALLAATLYRKNSQLDKALEILKPYMKEEKGDLDIAVNMASLLRDKGRVDDAFPILRKASVDIMSTKGLLAEGWYTVVNGYIANCIDRGRPGEAVEAASFLMRNANHQVNAQTAALLLFELRQCAALTPDAKSLVEEVERQLDTVVLDGDATKARAWIESAKDHDQDAVKIIDQHLVQLPQAGRKLAQDKHYLLCAKGRILLKANRIAESTTVLEEAQCLGAFAGEAYFFLSVAYAKLSNEEKAVSWLERAIKTRGYWTARARHNEALAQSPAAMTLLKDVAQNSLS